MATRTDEEKPSTPNTLVDETVKSITGNDTTITDCPAEKKTECLQDDAVSSTTTITDQERGTRDNEQVERLETIKQPLVKVPRSQRRGLFARFALIPEVTEPTHYPNSTKWLITAIVGLAAAAAPVGSSIIFPALDQVVNEFHTKPTTVNLSVALYMLSMAIFPLWWSAFSETLGRRTIYIVSFALFIVFGVLAAVSKSIAMLVVMRMLTGGASASVQAVGAGTVADVWETHERGRAIGYFFLGPLLGPLLAPIIGGVLGETLGWRATQWALGVFGVVIWILIFFALPETLRARKDISAAASGEEGAGNNRPPLSRTSTRESVQRKSKQYAKILRMLFVDPLMVLGYLRFPPVLLTVYYSAITFGGLYVLAVSIQYSFEKPPYEFSTLAIGALYAFNAVGYIMSSVLGGRWMDRIMKREAKKRQNDSHDELVLLPEDRMRENAWLGALLYPAALIWYGWTTQKGVFWLVPMIANFFYGVGSMLIFAMSTTMLTEFMPGRSSSGVGLNNFVRNILSCVGALVTAPLIDAIGDGWVFTILGLWSLSSCVVIWAMKRFGPGWRKKMDEALR